MINANGTFLLKKNEKDEAEELADEPSDDDAEGQEGPSHSLVRVFGPFKVIRRIEHVSGDVSVDCAFIDTKGRHILVTASSDEFLSSDLLKRLTKKGLKIYRSRGALTFGRTNREEHEGRL